MCFANDRNSSCKQKVLQQRVDQLEEQEAFDATVQLSVDECFTKPDKGNRKQGHHAPWLLGSPRPVQMPAVKAGKGAKKKSNAKKEVTPSIILSNACLNNLKHLTVQFPVNRFILVTGVSGSGKSSLIRDCLVPLAKEAINKNGVAELDTMKLEGIDVFNAIHEVDQSPIGRTPRSTPRRPCTR